MGSGQKSNCQKPTIREKTDGAAWSQLSSEPVHFLIESSTASIPFAFILHPHHLYWSTLFILTPSVCVCVCMCENNSCSRVEVIVSWLHPVQSVHLSVFSLVFIVPVPPLLLLSRQQREKHDGEATPCSKAGPYNIVSIIQGEKTKRRSPRNP